MIGKLLNGIISLIVGLISLILSPIDLAIQQFLPGLDSALTSVNNLFTLISSSLSWGISTTGLSSDALSLIVLYYTFKLTVPMLFYMIKLALSWYNRLKP